MMKKDEKNILQMIFTPMKVPKGKIKKWLFWKWFHIWHVSRNKLLAWLFGGLANFIDWLVPNKYKDDNWYEI